MMATVGALALLLAATGAFAPSAISATAQPHSPSPYAEVHLAETPSLFESSPSIHHERRDLLLLQRATSNAPNGYTPASVDCPGQRPAIRNGSGLSPQEIEWLPRRRNQTIGPIRDLLKRIAIPGFDSGKYLQDAEKDAKALPNIGLAVSGGGYRAMLTGAGAFAAWDNRSDGSLTQGNLGGLLQSATYLSGLSGGGWLVGSIYTNNFTTVNDAVNSDIIWQFQDSIFKGPSQYSILQYYRTILDEVKSKDDAKFDRSITDYWGRLLSYQLINAVDGGPGFTFSSIANDPGFSSAKTPLPFLIANGRAPNQKVISSNSTVFDFSPWELGSSDPSLNGYVPLQYVGSKFNNGTLPDNEACISGFDNAGFVMGTSSSLFNQIVLYLKDSNNKHIPSNVPKFVVDALTSVLGVLGNSENDIADWTPNPFKGWNPANNPGANSDRLTLVDGGEDLQNVPYHPHLLRDRHVDVVFSIDSSADTESAWPDGASAIATYQRSLEGISDGTGFPAVPGKNTFLNLGLNTKPVFFGCNASNMSAPAPLIVYLPNYPYLYASNISTFQMSIEEDQRDAIIRNGWAVATQHNSSRDADWPICVGCAMLARSFNRTSTTIPDKCQQCFQRYCWDGKLDESTPKPYYPAFYTKPIATDSSDAPTFRVRYRGAMSLTMSIAAYFVLF